jgi:hypothetical protein
LSGPTLDQQLELRSFNLKRFNSEVGQSLSNDSFLRQAAALHSRVRDYDASQEFSGGITCYHTFLASSLLNRNDDGKDNYEREAS